MSIELKDSIIEANTGADAIQRAPIVDYNTGKKCLRIGDISNHRKYNEWGYTEVTEENYKKYKLEKEDILIARTGSTIGINLFIEQDYQSVYNNGLIRLKTDKSKYNSKFIYYVMQSNKFKNYINGIAFGTTGQPNMKIDDLLKFKFQYVSLEIQNKIVKILDTLDKKIKLNNQMNDNLYHISKSIFKDFYKKNSENWNLIKINDIGLYISDYVANGSFKNLAENVKIYDEKNYALFIRNTDLKVNFTQERKYVDEHSYHFLSKSKLFGREVIISNVGDVGSIFLCPSFKIPMTLGNNIIMVDSKKTEVNYNYYLYYFFLSVEGQYLINGITGGSAQPKFNKTDFRNSRIKIPSKNEITNFNNKIIPIYDMIEKNKKENSILEKIKNILLPKLMSGEINLEKIVIG